ncbi:hypothetical protein K0U83_21410 [bacterium]|nr:hypothetical protein [bacterium]
MVILPRVLAIDPGPTRSGFCEFDPNAFQLIDCGDRLNVELKEHLERTAKHMGHGDLVIEQVAHYGARVGQTVFETCFWSGIFARAWDETLTNVYRLKFTDVAKTICHRHREKEAGVWRAVRDMFPHTGGGSNPEIGIAADPGPLFALRGTVNEHSRSALAVAIAHAILSREHGGQYLRDHQCRPVE